MTRPAAAILTALFLAGCGPSEKASAPEAPLAADIARETLIVDGHIDVPIRLVFRPDDISEATETGDFDYPRAVAGGLNAPFMSIYTPADYMSEPGKSFEFANSLIDMVEGFVADDPDKFAIARTVDELGRHFEAGLISLPLGMENGSPLEGELGNLDHFFDRGIRYITLCHSLSNRIADSSYDENRQWRGLSDFGVDVVKRMNALGIIVDVSHVSDEAFWQVLEVSSAPVIASHSSARHFTPDWERNMSDDMIKALAEAGGVIMINFGSAFLTDEARRYSDARGDALKAYLEENPDLEARAVRDAFYASFAEENGPYPYADLADVLDHIDHVVAIAGIDVVGIGSDYDGVGDSLPVGLKDVSSFPNLVQGLLDRGYSRADIEKILSGNVIRVWRAVEAIAAS